MTKKKPEAEAAESKPHGWDRPGLVPVTIKFTEEGHRRAKVHAAGYRGRMLSALVNAAVEYVLDEIDAGRTPKAFAAKMAAATRPAPKRVRKPAGASA